MMGTLRRILFSSCLLWTQIRSLNASFSCSSSHDCETALMDGSQCVSGFCTNPLHYGGCLHRMLPGWHKIRTCNSDDPPNAAIDGYCRVSPMGYREVRIESQEWLTAYFGAWILQILLGELLDVPVTIESGSPDVKLSLYDLESSYGSFSSSDFQAYRVASEVEDCTHVKNIGSEVYTPCAHVNAEYWIDYLLEDNVDLDLQDLGLITSIGWSHDSLHIEIRRSFHTWVSLEKTIVGNLQLHSNDRLLGVNTARSSQIPNVKSSTQRRFVRLVTTMKRVFVTIWKGRSMVPHTSWPKPIRCPTL